MINKINQNAKKRNLLQMSGLTPSSLLLKSHDYQFHFCLCFLYKCVQKKSLCTEAWQEKELAIRSSKSKFLTAFNFLRYLPVKGNKTLVSCD